VWALVLSLEKERHAFFFLVNWAGRLKKLQFLHALTRMNPSHYTSVTPHITNLPRNIDHVPANPNDSKEIKFQKKIFKFKLLLSLVLMSLSRNFYYFSKLNYTLVPQQKLILVTCTARIKIIKNLREHEVLFQR
jgi:hypothetical protein